MKRGFLWGKREGGPLPYEKGLVLSNQGFNVSGGETTHMGEAGGETPPLRFWG